MPIGGLTSASMSSPLSTSALVPTISNLVELIVSVELDSLAESIILGDLSIALFVGPDVVVFVDSGEDGSGALVGSVTLAFGGTDVVPFACVAGVGDVALEDVVVEAVVMAGITGGGLAGDAVVERLLIEELIFRSRILFSWNEFG